ERGEQLALAKTALGQRFGERADNVQVDHKVLHLLVATGDEDAVEGADERRTINILRLRRLARMHPDDLMARVGLDEDAERLALARRGRQQERAVVTALPLVVGVIEYAAGLAVDTQQGLAAAGIGAHIERLVVVAVGGPLGAKPRAAPGATPGPTRRDLGPRKRRVGFSGKVLGKRERSCF